MPKWRTLRDAGLNVMRVIESGIQSRIEPIDDMKRYPLGATGLRSSSTHAVKPGLPDPSAFLVALGGRRVVAEPALPGVLVPSHRGVDSLRWTLSLDGRPASLFLKVLDPEQRSFVDVEASFDAQGKAAALGCTPAIRVLDVTQGASVTELLDGWKTARVDDLRKPDVLEKVLTTKRTIHKGPRLRQSWTVFDRVRALERKRATFGADMPDDLLWMLDSVAHIERAIAAAGWDAVPAHADGLASNIMIGPKGQIQLIDFDEARNIDPYFEFGILLNEAFQSDEEIETVLDMIEGAPRRTGLARIHLYAIADDLAWGLWGLVMDATSARTDVEFLKYGYWRLLRCRMRLQRTDLLSQLKRL